MGFRVRENARDWFRNIKAPTKDSPHYAIRHDWDVFYLCLMLGLAKGRYVRLDPGTTREFNKSFIRSYQPYRTLILGLLLVAEVKGKTGDLDDREEIRQAVHDLFDPGESTGLSTKGLERLNQYASGGYDYLTEQLEEKPHHAETFLQQYVKLLNRAVEQNESWQEFEAKSLE